MPGVTVQTGVRSGPAVVADAPAATFFVAGFTERGPTDEPILLRSLGDYRRFFGERVSYGAVYDAIQAYFEEGGVQAYVGRTVGPAATKGFLVLVDRAGTPVNTLRIEALGPGAWSGGVTVEVADGTGANTVDVTVRYAGEEEKYTNLASPSAIVTALRVSKWVRAIDQGSASAVPNNNPAVIAATALSAGADDRASATITHHVAALDRLGAGLGAGAVAIPGQPGTTAAAGILAHCKANKRIGLLATAAGVTPTQAITDKTTIQAAVNDEEYLGLFYPWVQVPDGAGGIRTVSPEGYVAGVRARAQVTDGPWRAPGGTVTSSRFVVGVERVLTRAEGDSLDENEVSSIRVIAGSIRLYGWRSLSADEENYKLLNGRDMLNYLAAEGERRLEQYVLRNIDERGHLFSELAAEIIGLVEPIKVAGGLYGRVDPATGQQLDPGYKVDVGPGINTEATLASGEAIVALSVRIAPTGSLIRFIVTKVALTASL